MKTRAGKLKGGGWPARSVLECGSPLALMTGVKHSQTPQSAGGPAQSKNWRRNLIYFCFLFFSLQASGRSYSINWYKMASGGGTSSNGQYSVSGTIGQPDASGPMAGGSYSLTSGFWALISVVQAPGLPSLTITHSGNSVVVSWPNTGGYTLQQNSNLATGNWATSGYSIATANGTNSITITPPAGNLFFRLKQ